MLLYLVSHVRTVTSIVAGMDNTAIGAGLPGIEIVMFETVHIDGFLLAARVRCQG